MQTAIKRMTGLHRCLFGALEARTDGWFIGLSARLWFAAILLPYYFNSAMTKVAGSFPSAGAFAQIVPSIADQYLYDTAAIPFFPWHIIVIAGILAEFVLPVLIVLGLFTRLGALGMIGFVAVQTVVDITAHGAAAGALFDGQPDQLIDQRMLWVFVLLMLAIKGAGKFSLDHVLGRRARDG
jgi:putative oxidoreductase